MRILSVNSKVVDIDEKTAIGVTTQGYSITKPSVRKTNYTNTFSIPRTAKNSQIFGFAGSPQSNSKVVYDKLKCSYVVNNLLIMDNAFLQVQSISNDRIFLFAYAKADIWDDLRSVKWVDFIEDWIKTIGYETMPTYSDPFSGSLQNFIGAITSLDVINRPTEHTVLRFSTLNSEGCDVNHQVPNEFTFSLASNTNLNGTGYVEGNPNKLQDCGTFTLYVSKIFQAISLKFGYSFLAEFIEDNIPNNFFNDRTIQRLTVSAQFLVIRRKTSSGGWYIDINRNAITGINEDGTNKNTGAILENITVFDFVDNIIKTYNLIPLNILQNGKKATKLTPFNDLENNTDVLNFSLMYAGKYTFKPLIKDLAQVNKITHQDEKTDFLELQSFNKNIVKEKNILTLDKSYFPLIGGKIGLPDVSTVKESLQLFSLFSIGENPNLHPIICKYRQGTTTSITDVFNYPLDEEIRLRDSTSWTFFNKIINYPIVYEVDMWIPTNYLLNFDQSKTYFIAQLGGTFFIEKIAGYNPIKSKQAVKVTLIRVSIKLPTKKIAKNTNFFNDKKY